MRDKTVLHTLERGLQVLEAVAAPTAPPPRRSAQPQLGIKLGTCYHLLRTLLTGGHGRSAARRPLRRRPPAASLNRHLQRRSGPRPSSVILDRLHNRTHETSYIPAAPRNADAAALPFRPARGQRRQPRRGYTGHMHARASCKAVCSPSCPRTRWPRCSREWSSRRSPRPQSSTRPPHRRTGPGTQPGLRGGPGGVQRGAVLRVAPSSTTRARQRARSRCPVPTTRFHERPGHPDHGRPRGGRDGDRLPARRHLTVLPAEWRPPGHQDVS